MKRDMGTTSPRSVLMIDDNLEVQEVFRRVLEYDGYEVVTARTGTDGVSLAGQRHFDLIITDLMLPDLHGYDVARQLRAGASTANVPIAAFTVRTSPEDEARAHAAGCDDVITKPCAIDEFMAHVHRLVPGKAM